MLKFCVVNSGSPVGYLKKKGRDLYKFGEDLPQLRRRFDAFVSRGPEDAKPADGQAHEGGEVRHVGVASRSMDNAHEEDLQNSRYDPFEPQLLPDDVGSKPRSDENVCDEIASKSQGGVHPDIDHEVEDEGNLTQGYK